MKLANQDPLTRPAPAGEGAVAGHPLPQGGEGIFTTGGEPKDQGPAKNLEPWRGWKARLADNMSLSDLISGLASFGPFWQKVHILAALGVIKL